MMRLTLIFASVLSLAGCSRHDDGKITADPDRSVRTGMPVVFVAPNAPPADPGAPAALNPLAMPLKHDGPPGTDPPIAAAPIDPCAAKDEHGPLAMRLRHDGQAQAQGDKPARNPLCMRLK